MPRHIINNKLDIVKMRYIFKCLSSILLLLMYLFPSSLLGQEDLSVTFTYKSSREYTCSIQNTTNYRMTIWLGTDSDGDGNSEIRFDKVVFDKDTIQNIFYPLWETPDVFNYTVRLRPKQIYKISYKESVCYQLIRAKVFIKYFVNSPVPKNGFYEKDF